MKSHPIIVDEISTCNCPMCMIIRYIKENGCTTCCYCGTDLRNGGLLHACTGEEKVAAQCNHFGDCDKKLLRDLTGGIYIEITKNNPNP